MYATLVMQKVNEEIIGFMNDSNIEIISLQNFRELVKTFMNKVIYVLWIEGSPKLEQYFKKMNSQRLKKCFGTNINIVD